MTRSIVHFATGFPVIVMSPSFPHTTLIPPESFYHASTLALCQPTQTLRDAIGNDVPSPLVPTRTCAGAETPPFTVNDRNDTVHNSSPPLVHTRSTHSQLPMPHRTCEGVQQPDLTVSTKHVIKLITLTFFSLRAHRTRTLASRLQPTGTRARMRQHLSLSPSHSLTSPTQTLRNAIDDNALLPPVPTRTRAGAEMLHYCCTSA